MSIVHEKLREMEKLRDKLEKELMANPDFVMHQELSRAIDAIKARLSETSKSAPQEEARKVIRRRRARKGRRGHAALVYDIIKQSGRPVTSSALIEALEKAGNPVGGSRKTTNLSSVLSKDDRFDSVLWPPSSQTRAWWLKGETLPSPSVDDLLTTDSLSGGNPEIMKH